jgi:hypothetical protein
LCLQASTCNVLACGDDHFKHTQKAKLHNVGEKDMKAICSTLILITLAKQECRRWYRKDN